MFFDGLSKDAFALLNYDDKHGETMGLHSPAKVKSYGLNGALNIKGKVLENHFSGLSMEVDDKEMISRLIGDFNAYNLLVAYGVAACLGEDKLTVLTTLSSLKAPEGRFEYFTSQSNVIIVVDYANTPDALENVLKTIHAIKKGGESIISVFGCGGDRDTGKRPLMGKIAAEYSNRVIVTSDNPRSENPEKILEDITKRNVFDVDHYLIEGDHLTVCIDSWTLYFKYDGSKFIKSGFHYNSDLTVIAQGCLEC